MTRQLRTRQSRRIARESSTTGTSPTSTKAGHRLAAVAVLALLCGGAGAWFLLRARAGLRGRDGGPFALTLGELRQDRAGLRPSPPSVLDAPPAPPP